MSGKRLQHQVESLVEFFSGTALGREERLDDIESGVSNRLKTISQINSESGRAADGVLVESLLTELRGLALEVQNLENKNAKIKREILTSLHYPQISARYEQIAEAHEKTFAWALHQPPAYDPTGEDVENVETRGNLLQWLQSGCGIFWVSGKPGSGKSTFMKFVGDHSATKHALATWASPHRVVITRHYFWGPGTDMQKSQHGLWRSLLHDLLQQLPDFIPTVCETQWKSMQRGQIGCGEAWTATGLRKAFNRFCDQDFSNLRVCVFIDGLDEFNGDYLDMCNLLIAVSRFPYLKVCIASRPWNVFETNFGKRASQRLYLHLLTRRDVEGYTRSRFEEHPEWWSDLTPEQRDTLVVSVTTRAEGVFLWVTLATRELREGISDGATFRQLQAMLEHIPPELEDFFLRILEGVRPFNRGGMAAVLKTVFTGSTPYHFMVYHFLEQEVAGDDFGPKRMVCAYDKGKISAIRARVIRRLDALCKGLLEIRRDDQVDFIHRTVHDWLLTPPMAKYLNERVPADFNATLSVLRAYLAWYHHPDPGLCRPSSFPKDLDPHLESMPLPSYHGQNPLTQILFTHLGGQEPDLREHAYLDGHANITNGILDEFHAVTIEIYTLGWISPNSAESCNDQRNSEEPNLLFKALVFHAGLWNYLWSKLENEPNWLNCLARSGAVECSVRRGDRCAAHLRSRVATTLLGSILRDCIPEYVDKHDWRRAANLSRQDPRRFVEVMRLLCLDFGADLAEIVPSVGAALSELRRFAGLLVLTTDLILDYSFQSFLLSLLRLCDPLLFLREVETGVTLWDVLCSAGRNRQISTGRELVFGQSQRQLFFQYCSLVDAFGSMDTILPWDRLRVAISQNLGSEEGGELLTRIKEKSLIPKSMMLRAVVAWLLRCAGKSRGLEAMETYILEAIMKLPIVGIILYYYHRYRRG